MIGDAQQKGPEKTTSEFAPSETLNKEQQTEESDLTAEAGINAGNILDGIDDNGEMVDSLKMSESGEGVGEHRQATGKKFGDFKQKMTKQEAEQLKKKLLKALPPPKTMIKEIRAHIHQEIKDLQKEAAKAERKGKFKELAEAVARMRELRIMLYDLLHATIEFVKNLWLKVVHGIV